MQHILHDIIWEIIVVGFLFKIVLGRWMAERTLKVIGWILKRVYIQSERDWQIFMHHYHKALSKK